MQSELESFVAMLMRVDVEFYKNQLDADRTKILICPIKDHKFQVITGDVWASVSFTFDSAGELKNINVEGD